MQFEDPRDAEDAIRGRDGYNFDGSRLRVCRVCHYRSLAFCFSCYDFFVSIVPF